MIFHVFEKFILPQIVNQVVARILVDGSRRKIKYNSWQEFRRKSNDSYKLLQDIQLLYESFDNRDFSKLYTDIVNIIEKRFVDDPPKKEPVSTIEHSLQSLYPDYHVFDSEEYKNRDDDVDVVASFIYSCLNPKFSTIEIVYGAEQSTSTSGMPQYDEFVLKVTLDPSKHNFTEDHFNRSQLPYIFKEIENYLDGEPFHFLLFVSRYCQSGASSPFVSLSNFKLNHKYSVLSSGCIENKFSEKSGFTEPTHPTNSFLFFLSRESHWRSSSDSYTYPNSAFNSVGENQRQYSSNTLHLTQKNYFFSYKKSVIDEFKGDLVSIFSERIEKFHLKNDVYKIMFAGKPGGGKSLLAKSLGLNKRVLEISNGVFSDIDNLSFDTAIISLTPDIIIIDDISDVHNGLTRKLDAFDGYSSIFSHYKDNKKKLVIIMTCNDPDKIKSSFLRPGRIDEFVDFDLLMADKPERYEIIINSLLYKRGVEIDPSFLPLLVEIFQNNTIAYVDEIIKRFDNFGTFRFEVYDSHWKGIDHSVKVKWNEMVDKK